MTIGERILQAAGRAQVGLCFGVCEYQVGRRGWNKVSGKGRGRGWGPSVPCLGSRWEDLALTLSEMGLWDFD